MPCWTFWFGSLSHISGIVVASALSECFALSAGGEEVQPPAEQPSPASRGARCGRGGRRGKRAAPDALEPDQVWQNMLLSQSTVSGGQFLVCILPCLPAGLCLLHTHWLASFLNHMCMANITSVCPSLYGQWVWILNGLCTLSRRGLPTSPKGLPKARGKLGSLRLAQHSRQSMPSMF